MGWVGLGLNAEHSFSAVHVSGGRIDSSMPSHRSVEREKEESGGWLDHGWFGC